jgi:2-desacetyl-2-hydroxyethyl bacteriochlorophyllide A dehydrogenase
VTVVGQRVVFPERGTVEIQPFEVADPGPSQIRVRALCSAVSAGTELTGLLGEGRARFPAYPGYAHVGEVVAAGRAVEGIRPGDRVLSMGHHQTDLLLDLSPERPGGPEYVERLPDGLSPELAAWAILGSVALHGIRRAELQIGQAVAVFGQGIVGQLIVQLARAGGASPIVGIDVVAQRLEESRISGADAALDPARDDLVAEIGRLTGGRGAELVFDATRTPKTLPTMMKVAANGGKVLMVGSAMGTVELDAFTELQLKELSIVGCFQPAAPLEPHHFLPWTQRRNRETFMRLTATGQVRLDHLITHRAPFREAPAIYEMIRRGGHDWLGVLFTYD